MGSLMSGFTLLKSTVKAVDNTILTVEVFDRGAPGQAPLNDNYWTRYINDNFGKKNNITVKFVSVPRSQEVDKLNILMAANEAPDICFTYDQNTINKYVKQGGITQLDSLLTKYGANLKKYLGEDLLDFGFINGKQMAIPAKRTILANQGAFIRQDWLDKLGLPLPKTTQEFYNTMVAFRDKNPGNVKGVIPYVPFNFYLVQWSFWTKMSAVDFATLPDWQKPGNKEAYKFLNKLYNEKLMSPDFAIDTTKRQAEADISNGKGGFMTHNFDYPLRTNPGLYTNLKKNVKDAVLTPVDTFQNYAGKYYKNEYTPAGVFIVIPKASKHAVEAIKYLNWMSDPQNIFFLQNGEEGVGHKMVDGIPQALALTGDKKMNSPYNIDYCLITNGSDLNDSTKNIKAIAKSYPGFEAEAAKAIKIAQTDTYRNFWFTNPSATGARYTKTLNDRTNEMTAKLVYAKPADFDKLYDSLVGEYMSAGGQVVKAEAKKLYYAQTIIKKKAGKK